MYIGSDDGVYRVSTDATERVLPSGRVMRLDRFASVEGLFAATRTGLYRSLDGDSWTGLGVPREAVYSVGADGDGRLYAGTRPAHLHAAETLDGETTAWREVESLRTVPSREAWRLPRHENLAQVRDVHVDGERLVVGVEVGGVHVTADGRTWADRTPDPDVHELHVVGPGTYAAATGDGLYRSTDAGRSWTRLDDALAQGYFRSVHAHDGTLFAGGALSNSSTWEDDDADPALVAVRDGATDPVPIPYPDETVTGMTVDDGTLVVVTHRGHLLRRTEDGWSTAGRVPTTGEVTGRYTPVVPG